MEIKVKNCICSASLICHPSTDKKKRGLAVGFKPFDHLREHFDVCEHPPVMPHGPDHKLSRCLACAAIKLERLPPHRYK